VSSLTNAVFENDDPCKSPPETSSENRSTLIFVLHPERIIEADKINMMLKKSWHHTGGSTSAPIVLIVVKLTFESLCDGKKTPS